MPRRKLSTSSRFSSAQYTERRSQLEMYSPARRSETSITWDARLFASMEAKVSARAKSRVIRREGARRFPPRFAGRSRKGEVGADLRPNNLIASVSLWYLVYQIQPVWVWAPACACCRAQPCPQRPSH